MTEERGERFWLVLQEPGRIPERKGPWRKDKATVLREFMEARPTAYIHVLTVNAEGEPWIDHGPEVLQMLDARSMNTGRKHNERVRAAHSATNPDERLREALEECRLIVANLPHGEKLLLAKIDAALSHKD